MIIVLKQEAKTEDVTRIEKTIEEKGLQVHVSKGENQTIMGLIGDTTKVDPESIEVDPAALSWMIRMKSGLWYAVKKRLKMPSAFPIMRFIHASTWNIIHCLNRKRIVTWSRLSLT